MFLNTISIAVFYYKYIIMITFHNDKISLKNSQRKIMRFFIGKK